MSVFIHILVCTCVAKYIVKMELLSVIRITQDGGEQCGNASWKRDLHHHMLQMRFAGSIKRLNDDKISAIVG